MQRVGVCALLLTSFAGATLDASPRAFFDFAKKYQKFYATAGEYQERFAIFAANVAEAERFNVLNEGSAEFGVTKFMDLSPEEFKAGYLNSQVFDEEEWKRAQVEEKTDFPQVDLSHLEIYGAPDPTNWNWVDQNVTTPIYDQGRCGSCWAFSATETIESYLALGGGPLESLSMEQLVECDGGSWGCAGGWPYTAYEYVKSSGGIDLFSTYPYSSANGVTGSCKEGKFNQRNATINTWQHLAGEKGIYSQVSTAGPVSICVDASSWQFYKTGILKRCGTDIDHCVQIVGYGNYSQDNSHWIVRNSWGSTWGQEGYIFLETGHNVCALGNMPTVCTASLLH